LKGGEDEINEMPSLWKSNDFNYEGLYRRMDVILALLE